MKLTLPSRLHYYNTLLTAGFACGGNKPVARGVVKLRQAGLALVQNLPLMKNCMSSAALDNSNEQHGFAIA